MDDTAVLTYNPETPTPTKSLDDMKKEIYEHVESKAEACPQEEVFEWREVVRGLSICPLQPASVNNSYFSRHP